jgi:hypothetical protein
VVDVIDWLANGFNSGGLWRWNGRKEEKGIRLEIEMPDEFTLRANIDLGQDLASLM